MSETETPSHDAQQEPEQQEGRESREQLLTGIGQRLREVREERQLGTDEIARELKLRAAYLTALENGDWSTLPGDIYGIGFARQYARYLGMDMEDDIARISSGEYELTKPLTFPDPPIAPAKRWAVTAALLFILLFIAFNVFHSAVHRHQHPSEVAAVHPTAPPPTPATKPTTAPASSPATKTAVKPATPSAPVASQGSKPAAPQSKPPAAATAEPGHKPAATSAPAAAPTASAKPTYAHRYRFEAVGGDVWLQLYNGPNNLVKEALLRQGQHMDVDTDAASLTLDCGNIGAVAISIDGKSVVTAGQLGPIGKVVRNYLLKAPAP